MNHIFIQLQMYSIKEVQDNGNSIDIELPFTLDKPLNQMNREELQW